MEFINKVYSAVLQKILEVEGKTKAKEVEEYLVSLKPSVRSLRTGYQNRSVKIDYSKKENQFAYLLAYYPHYVYMTFSALSSFFEKYQNKAIDIDKKVYYVDFTSYENYGIKNLDLVHIPDTLSDYLNNTFGKSVVLKVAFFASGPCPEIIGTLHFISKKFPNVKNIECFLFDVNSSAWKTSNLITEKVIELLDLEIEVSFNYHDINFNDQNFFYEINLIISECNLCFMQNCLNEIGNQYSFIDNLILILRELRINNSLFFIIDLCQNNTVYSMLDKIENTLKKTELIHILKESGDTGIIHKRIDYVEPIVKKYLLDSSDKLIPRKNIYFNYLTLINHPYLNSIDSFQSLQEEKRRDFLNRIKVRGAEKNHRNLSMDKNDLVIREKILNKENDILKTKAIFVDCNFLVEAMELATRIFSAIYKFSSSNSSEGQTLNVERWLFDKLILTDLENNIINVVGLASQYFAECDDVQKINVYLFIDKKNCYFSNIISDNRRITFHTQENKNIVFFIQNIKSYGDELTIQFNRTARYSLCYDNIFMCDKEKSYDDLISYIYLQKKKLIVFRLDNFKTRIKSKSLWQNIIYLLGQFLGFNKQEMSYAIQLNRAQNTESLTIESVIHSLIAEEVNQTNQLKNKIDQLIDNKHYQKHSFVCDRNNVLCDYCNNQVSYDQGFYTFCDLTYMMFGNHFQVLDINSNFLSSLPNPQLVIFVGDMVLCNECSEEIFKYWDNINPYQIVSNQDTKNKIDERVIEIVLGYKKRGLSLDEAKQEARQLCLLWWKDQEAALDLIYKINNKIRYNS